MQRTALGFWLGVAASFALFILSPAGMRFDAEVTAGESRPVEFVEHVDQGLLSRLLAPAALPLGSVRLTKRNWGVVTFYSEQITVEGARLTRQAGSPLDLRVVLEIPGTVVGTNASGREGRALVWTAFPANTPLWAQTRAVNWPILAFLVVAAALSFVTRGVD